MTARAAARGRRAHHKCSVEGCPCRMLFSRAEAMLIASSGSETSMSFLADFGHHEGTFLGMLGVR